MDKKRFQGKLWTWLALLFVAGCILFIIFRSPRVYTAKTVTTDKKKILQELPALELTKEELALEASLRENEELLKRLEEIKATEEYEVIPLSPEMVEELAGHIIPDNVENAKMNMDEGGIAIDYSRMNVSTTIIFYWSDTMEPIKMIILDSLWEDGANEALYINTGNREYEKQRYGRVWFPRLREMLGSIHICVALEGNKLRRGDTYDASRSILDCVNCLDFDFWKGML